MTPDEKYTALRKAAIEMIGVQDDPGVLLEFLAELHRIGAHLTEDGSVAAKLVVALIETGKD